MNTEPETGIEAGATVEIPAEAAVIPANQTQTVTVDNAVPADLTPGFDSMGLSSSLLQAITEAGYKTPTPIQAQGIPYALQRRDLIGIAQTGTGKTASFALPMIELLSRGRAKARMPRSLILEPTRELAAQVAESFDQYTKYNKLSMALLIGGVSFEEQDRKLDRGADILIATPGRLMDHFERGKLMLSQVQILVVDEADRMLDMGFIPDVERICKLIPFTRQTLFYSATMPTEIRRLTEQFLQNPARIEVARPATTASNIVQMLVEVPANDWAKREALRRLIIEAGEIKNAIVFCNRKHDVDIVARSLKKHGFNAAPLHGDLDQSLRTKTLDSFRSGELQLLVASDVAARGLDIPDVSHVFNFDVPFHSDDYVHRIGRTGRAGRHGAAFMLVTPRDNKYVDDIEKLTKSKLERRVLEGLAEAVQDRPARPERERGRGRERGRDRDRQHREYPVKPHGQMAAMEPAKPGAQERPKAQERQPKKDWSRPERAEAAPTSVKPQAPVKQQAKVQAAPVKPIPSKPVHNRPEQNMQGKSKQSYRDYNRREWLEPEKPDISQLPAFLLRPVPLPKLVEKKPAEKPTSKPVQKHAQKPVEKKPVEIKAVAPVVVPHPAPVIAQAPEPVVQTVAPVIAETTIVEPVVQAVPVTAANDAAPSVEVTETKAKKPRARRAPRKKAAETTPETRSQDAAVAVTDDASAPVAEAAPAKKPRRPSRPRKKATEKTAEPATDTPVITATADEA
ncbi:MAG: DEAD/DEAH box helicase [Rhizomicrobium sp.]